MTDRGSDGDPERRATPFVPGGLLRRGVLLHKAHKGWIVVDIDR
jgi:hypothetical protein